MEPQDEETQEWCYEEGKDGDPECPTGGFLTGMPEFVTCQLCKERFGLFDKDIDFRQRMHFMGPPGHKPCTIPWPHIGPCAHPSEGGSWRKQTLGREIITEWYDGPLRSMRAVHFDDGDRMVQVETNLADVSEPYQFGYAVVHDVMVRFDREDVMNMLRILDGQPVKDYRDEDVVSEPEGEPEG